MSEHDKRESGSRVGGAEINTDCFGRHDRVCFCGEREGCEKPDGGTGYLSSRAMT